MQGVGGGHWPKKDCLPNLSSFLVLLLLHRALSFLIRNERPIKHLWLWGPLKDSQAPSWRSGPRTDVPAEPPIGLEWGSSENCIWDRRFSRQNTSAVSKKFIPSSIALSTIDLDIYKQIEKYIYFTMTDLDAKRLNYLKLHTRETAAVNEPYPLPSIHRAAVEGKIVRQKTNATTLLTTCFLWIIS